MNFKLTKGNIFFFFNNYLPLIVLLGSVLLFIKFSIDIEFFRYDNFQVGKFDTGNMIQAIWSTSKGRFLEITDTYGTNATRFGNSHIDLILALFAPIFYFFPNPKILMASQIIVLGFGAFAIFLIADRFLKSRWAALFISIAFLLHPAIQNMAVADFHGVIFSSVFLLFAFYLIEAPEPGESKTRRVFIFLTRRVKPVGFRRVLLWFFIILALVGREDVSAVIAFMGIYAWIIKKKQNLGKTIALVGLLWFVTSFFVIIPRFGDIRVQSQKEFALLLGKGEEVMSEGLEQNFFLEHFKEYGSGYQEIIRNIFLKPEIFIKKIFDPGNLKYINKIAIPLAFLPYLSPHIIAISLPNLMISFLGEGSRYRSLIYHHVSIPTAFFFIATIVAIYSLVNLFTNPTGWRSKVFGFAKRDLSKKVTTLSLSFMVFLSSLNYAGSFSAPIYPHFLKIMNTRLERHAPWIYSFKLFPKKTIKEEKKIDTLSMDREEIYIESVVEKKEEFAEEPELGMPDDPNWASLLLTNPRENNSAKEILELIPNSASVSVPNYMGAYTAMREGNALFPANYNLADFVVIDFFTPQFIRDLGNLEVNLIIPSLLKNLLEDESFTLIYSGGGIVALEKDSKAHKPFYEITKLEEFVNGRDYIEYETPGVRLHNIKIHEEMVVGEKYKFAYDWSIFKRNNFKRFFVTSFLNKETGQIFQEVHIPSFALSPLKEWELERVYREEFELILPKSIRSGTFEVIVGVKRIVGESITGYNIGEVKVVNQIIQ